MKAAIKNIKLKPIAFLTILCTITFASGAPKNWIDSTNIRIDSLRKGNFEIKIVNAAGEALHDSIVVDMLSGDFPWGNVMEGETSPGADDWKRATMYKYYNAAVCGNAFKWSGTESTKGVLTYKSFENALAWTQQVGWPLKGHTLLWNGTAGNAHEVPAWVQKLKKNQMYNACKERIQRDVERYNGQVHEYDVFNEPTHTHFLTDSCGDSLIWNSFKWAREKDSTADLYINDYNQLEWGEYPKFVAIAKQCLDNGAPITGLGLQGHFPGALAWPDVKKRLDAMAVLGLQMRITEFDMEVTKYKLTQAQQAKFYALIMRIAFSYPSVSGFYFWGFHDADVWRAGSGIFANDRTPKIAADTVYNLIHKTWSTHQSGITNNDGIFMFRGFFGKYAVNAKINGVWKQYYIHCPKSMDGSVVTLSDTAGMLPKPRIKAIRVISTSKVVLTFDKPMADPSAEISNFRMFTTKPCNITKVSLAANDAKSIVVETSAILTGTAYVTISHMAGSLYAADSSAAAIFGNEPAHNGLAYITSAETNNDGTLLTIRFNKALSGAGLEKTVFVVKVNGAATTFESVSRKADSAQVLEIVLTQPLRSSDVVSIAYKPGTLTTTDNVLVPEIADVNILNRMPVAIGRVTANNMAVYPNPATDVINIEAVSGIQQIQVKNILGQQVLSQQAENTLKYSIDIHVLPSGVYFLTTLSNIGTTTTCSFVKK